jgi:xylulokinase
VERFVRRDLPEGFPALTYIGGGAESALWCQTLADVLGCTIRQADQPVRANAKGAAFIAAVGIGALTWKDIPGLVLIAHHYEPDPAAQAVYDDRYRTFVSLYRRTKRIYSALGRR